MDSPRPAAPFAAPPVEPGPLPSTGAVSGVLEALAFFGDPAFARRRFERQGDVFNRVLLGQPMVFIRGAAAIDDLLTAGDGVEGWWPESVSQLLGSRSLANRNGAAHKARRRGWDSCFQRRPDGATAPELWPWWRSWRRNWLRPLRPCRI